MIWAGGEWGSGEAGLMRSHSRPRRWPHNRRTGAPKHAERPAARGRGRSHSPRLVTDVGAFSLCPSRSSVIQCPLEIAVVQCATPRSEVLTTRLHGKGSRISSMNIAVPPHNQLGAWRHGGVIHSLTVVKS